LDAGISTHCAGRGSLEFVGFCRCRRHLSEQYFTSGQFLSHFLRQTKGRLHTPHIF